MSVREIKFRCYDKEEGYMLTWENLLDGGDLAEMLEMGHKEDDNYSKTMQYTGLKDKDGKDIYEGDIVSFTDGYSTSNESGQEFYEYQNIGFIEWSNEEARYSVTNREETDLDVFWEEIEDSIVIGNIYENPKLLEVNN